MKLSEIPHFSHIPSDGRRLILQPWYDPSESGWHHYLQIEKNQFRRLSISNTISGLYWSTQPAETEDFELPLATLVAQHLSFPPVTSGLYSLVDDLGLVCASFEKLRIFWEYREEIQESRSLVQSELEAQFSQTRAMFDVLQKMVGGVAGLLRYPNGKQAMANLPRSFAKVALSGDSVRSVTDLMQRFGMPKALAEFYFSRASEFKRIRDIRVSIEHHGKRIPDVFETPRGFGVSTKGSASWSNLEVWSTHELLPNDIGSVSALSISLASTILDAMEGFNAVLNKIIDPKLLPVPVSVGNKIFLRGPLVGYLAKLPSSSGSAWLAGEAS